MFGMVVAIWVNCAAISAVLRSSTLVKNYKLSEERTISFERTKTNQDKLTRENNSIITTRQITLHIICINFQVVFFENNFREFGTLNAVCEEIIKLHIFNESRQEYFLKGVHLLAKMRQSVLPVFHSSSSRHATWFSLAVRRNFFKRIGDCLACSVYLNY